MPLMIYLGIAFCFFISKLAPVAKGVVACSDGVGAIARVILHYCHVLQSRFSSRVYSFFQFPNRLCYGIFHRTTLFCNDGAADTVGNFPRLTIHIFKCLFLTPTPLAFCCHHNAMEGLHD